MLESNKPTEAMMDVVRPLLMFEGSIRFRLRDHMEAGGWTTNGLTDDDLKCINITKAHMASMIYRMMEAERIKNIAANMDRVHEYVRKNDVVRAVKEYRAVAGASLKDAYDAVQKMINEVGNGTGTAS